MGAAAGTLGSEPLPPPFTAVERASASSALCSALLSPPGPAAFEDLAPERRLDDATLPYELFQAICRRRPEVLLYRFALVVAETGADELALPRAAHGLRAKGCLIRDAAELRPSGVLLLVQPPAPLSRLEIATVCQGLPAGAASLRLHPDIGAGGCAHWRATHLEAIRRFPRRFAACPRSLLLPCCSPEQLDALSRQLLLHGVSVRATAHGGGAAAASVCAFGAAPGPQEGEEEPPSVAGPTLPAGARVLAAEIAPAPPAGLVLPQTPLENSALVVFEDAAELGVADVARELLLASGLFLLVDRPCRLSMEELRLLLGLPAEVDAVAPAPAPAPAPVRRPRLRARPAPPPPPPPDAATLKTWLEHLAAADAHRLLVVRGHAAVETLAELVHGPTAGPAPLASRRRRLDVDEAVRPAPAPLFASLADLAPRVAGPPHPLRLGGRRPAAPVLAACCHSPLHAAATLRALAPELLGVGEAVVALPLPGGLAAAPPHLLSSVADRLQAAPLGLTAIRTLGDAAAPLAAGGARGAVPLAALRRGIGFAEVAASAPAVWVALVARSGLEEELRALQVLLPRVAAGSAVPCPLLEAYRSLLGEGAVVVWRPRDVDAIVDALWPEAGTPSSGAALTADFAARCVRLSEPRFGIGSAVGTTPCGAPRHSLPTWPPGAVRCANGGRLDIGGVHLRLELLPSSPSSESACRTLRAVVLAQLSLARAPSDSSSIGAASTWRARRLRVSVLLFPRCEDGVQSAAALWDGEPWRRLSEYPAVYTAESSMTVVSLSPVELLDVRLDGASIVADACGGKVRGGWRLREGGDLAVAGPPSDFAHERDAALRAAFLALAARRPVAKRQVALLFEVPSRHEPTVARSVARMVGGLPSLMVHRKQHAPAEAMLLGATLARLALALEREPVSAGEARCAAEGAAGCVIGASEALRCRLARLLDRDDPAQWLFPSWAERPRDWDALTWIGSDGASAVASAADAAASAADAAAWAADAAAQAPQAGAASLGGSAAASELPAHTERHPAARVLCNESVASVLEAWRDLAVQLPDFDECEPRTSRFLSLSCYGALIVDKASSFVSLEVLPSAGDVLVHFAGGPTGARPGAALWGPMPVRAKPGRLAAQLLLMLRFDRELGRHPELQASLCEGFLLAYRQDGGADLALGITAAVRLHLHAALVLLELLWALRQQGPGLAGFVARLPPEEVLRGELHREVELAAAAYAGPGAT